MKLSKWVKADCEKDEAPFESSASNGLGRPCDYCPSEATNHCWDRYICPQHGDAAERDWDEARNFVAKAMQQASKDLESYIKEGASVVNTGAGQSLKGTIRKLNLAADAGFKTAVILVDVPEKKALDQNISRAEKGQRNLIPKYKVIASNESARNNFKEYKKITDYSLVIKN